MAMNRSPVGNKISIGRFLLGVGSVLLLALAVKVGVESWHALAAGSLMTNWKGGTMHYRDGFKLTALLTAFAGAFCYFAIRPKTNQ